MDVQRIEKRQRPRKFIRNRSVQSDDTVFGRDIHARSVEATIAGQALQHTAFQRSIRSVSPGRLKPASGGRVNTGQLRG